MATALVGAAALPAAAADHHPGRPHQAVFFGGVQHDSQGPGDRFWDGDHRRDDNGWRDGDDWRAGGRRHDDNGWRDGDYWRHGGHRHDGDRWGHGDHWRDGHGWRNGGGWHRHYYHRGEHRY
ncbi:hypothetical protein [Streptomyces sp. NPDC007905]|uniref:hypothetical protein n=1 Tax=Streptomyces sp. NPDC007905 TaxID=3364788 RepID=UPI0036E651E8